MYDEQKQTKPLVDDSTEVSQSAYLAYLQEISQYKLLTAEEEIALFLKIQDGDSVARELFVNSNLRLVVSLAKKYYLPGYNQLLDLIQDGNLGLLKAVDQYDPEKGCRFSTFATYHIHKAIQRSSCRTGLPINLPQNKLSLLNKIRLTSERLESENGYKPSYSDVAEALGVSVGAVRTLAPYLSASVSLYLKVQEGDDREFIDVFSEYYKEDINQIERQCIVNETREEFRAMFSELFTEKEAYILCCRYGLFGASEKSVRDLAKELNMSEQGVRQSENRSLSKLGKHLSVTNKSLSDFL